MLDLKLLKGLTDRTAYNILKPKIPMDMISVHTKAVVAWIGLFYTTYPDAERVSPKQLRDYILLRNEGKEEDEGVKLAISLVDKLDNTPTPNTQSLYDTLLEMACAGEVGKLVVQYQQGMEVELVPKLQEVSTKYALLKGVNVDEPDSIESILDKLESHEGITFEGVPLFEEYTMPLQGGDSVLFAGRPDRGKCQVPDTKVLLADGTIKLAKDVVVGDRLAAPNGYNTVLSTTSGRDQLYRIKYPWGEYYDVNGAHILSLKRSKVEGKHKYGDILNVSVEEYLTWGKGRKDRYKGWKCGIELETKEQTMPPYILGVWLGDGTTSKPQITCGDKEVINEVISVYGEPTSTQGDEGISKYWGRSEMLTHLQELELLGNKHIPENYLLGDRNQRLELLAGLVDTDGYNTSTGIEIVFKSEELANQVLFLARSLGIHATINPKKSRATNSKSSAYYTYYKVLMGMEAHMIPCRVERKKLAKPVNPKRKGLQFGFEVIPLGEGEYVGWELDGDRLYLLGDFTVTHNTTWLSYLIPKACPSINRLYNGERGVLWLVNEGRADKILPRIYQGALGCTLDELYEMRHNGTLRQKFSEAIQAPDDFIKVLPFHGKTIQDLELLVQKYNPAMVVIDMVEHVGGIHLASKSETIGALWERLRTLALTYDYVSIGTAQISVEGSDNLYPTYEHLAYTKTAVQGYTDIIMMLGNRDVEGMENIRGLSLPKNKAKVGGKTSYPRLEFMVDFDRCQFYQRETNLVD